MANYYHTSKLTLPMTIGLSLAADSIRLTVKRYPENANGSLRACTPIESNREWRIEEARRHPNWCDFGFWQFLVDKNGNISDPRNLLPLTANLKVTPAEFMATFGNEHSSVLSIFVADSKSDFSNADVRVNINPEYGLEGESSHLFKTNEGDYNVPFRDLVNRVSVTAPPSISSGETVEFSVFIDKGASQTIYLEAVSGYLPNTRLAASSGVATGRVSALGLVPGESVKLKVGFKYLTGLCEIEIPVV